MAHLQVMLLKEAMCKRLKISFPSNEPLDADYIGNSMVRIQHPTQKSFFLHSAINLVKIIT